MKDQAIEAGQRDLWWATFLFSVHHSSNLNACPTSHCPWLLLSSHSKHCLKTPHCCYWISKLHLEKKDWGFGKPKGNLYPFPRWNNVRSQREGVCWKRVHCLFGFLRLLINKKHYFWWREGGRKKEGRKLFLMNIDVQIFDKLLASQIHQYIKRIINHNQVGFNSGVKDGSLFDNQSAWCIIQ